jgi:hypothetical protein
MEFHFTDHAALLAAFLDRRGAIVEAIDAHVLNVQNKQPARNRQRSDLERVLVSCFVAATRVPRSLSVLHGLAAAHVADGFEPLLRDGHSPRLDAVDLVARAYDHWHASRWPGRNGRIAFADVVFAVFVLAQLEHLSLRIWDAGAGNAQDRLQEVQRLLDRLNSGSSAGAFVRDARWLIQTAQGPLTRELAAYFRIADRVASSFGDNYRLEVHRAGAALAGGHLRSQQRYRAAETNRAFDDPEVLAITRNSNSMDAALLVGDLVPLLEHYEVARAQNDDDHRRALADTILQGLSADPDLFVTHLDLLEPATMIEEVFVAATGGRVCHTPAGERHVALLARYRELIERLAGPLIADCLELAPAARAYSPLGISYGFCADILWNVALSALTAPRSSELSLEDMFESRTRAGDKAARARTWEGLPIRPGEHEHFTSSLEWAQRVFEDVISRLRQCAAGNARPQSGRLLVVSDAETLQPVQAAIADGAVNAQEHVVTSDVQRGLASGATAFPRSHILSDRREGRYLASIEQDGKWFAVSKVILTACLARGKDAVVAVPAGLVPRLLLACPEILKGRGKRE